MQVIKIWASPEKAAEYYFAPHPDCDVETIAYEDYDKFALSEITQYTYPTSRRGKKEKCYTMECDDILTLDIETSSAWITKDGQVIPYTPRFAESYWNRLQPVVLPYSWQFGYNDHNYLGRDLHDVKYMLDQLDPDTHYIIWVHNYSYEFAFLSNFLKWKEVFAREAHHPIYAIPEEYPNVEFRCSYMLTRLSLDAWGKSVGCRKLTGSLDYNALRTPLTELTKEEIAYSIRDCQVMYAGLKKYKEEYGHVTKIPLTQTGGVRRRVKDALIKWNKNYQFYVKKLIPANAYIYNFMRDAFSGGCVHANAKYANATIKRFDSWDDADEYETAVNKQSKSRIQVIAIYDWGRAFDFASSYPAVMIAEKYPCKPFTIVENPQIEELDTDKYAYLMHLELIGVECITNNTYISLSKCKNESDMQSHNGQPATTKATIDNGRIKKSERVEIRCTEQDWLTISEAYKIERINIIEMYKSKKDYLPKPILEMILYYYKLKSELKGSKDKAALYAQAKEWLNSIYGMMVTAIINDDMEIDESNRIVQKYEGPDTDDSKYKTDDGFDWGTYHEDKGAYADSLVDARLKHLREQCKNEYFVAYQWGVWVSAYARRNLWKCILHKGDDGIMYDRYVIYMDTDSLKLTKLLDFDWYNKEIADKIAASCEHNGLDVSGANPCPGKAKPLGYFCEEDPWSEFRTLGAKRYVARYVEDGELHLTTAGINKECVSLLHNNINNYVPSLVFDKDATDNTKKLSLHVYNMPEFIMNKGQYDEWKSTDKMGIVMRPTSYEMSSMEDYIKVINQSREESIQPYKDVIRHNNMVVSQALGLEYIV